MSRKSALLLRKYHYNAQTLPRVQLQRNFDLDTLLVTKPRKIKRRNTAPGVNVNVNGTSLTSILKRNDLPFAIRGRRKSVSFGTVSRAPITNHDLSADESDSNISDITLYEPSIPQPGQSSIGNNITLSPPGPSSIVTQEPTTSSNNSHRSHSKKPLPELLPLTLTPTLNIEHSGTPATYGKKMPNTPKRLAKKSTVAIIMNRLLVLESNNVNDLMDDLSLEKIVDPIDTMDSDFGNIGFE